MNKLLLAAMAGLRSAPLPGTSRVEKFHHEAAMSGIVTEDEAKEIWKAHPYPEPILRLIIREKMKKVSECMKTSSIK